MNIFKKFFNNEEKRLKEIDEQVKKEVDEINKNQAEFKESLKEIPFNFGGVTEIVEDERNQIYVPLVKGLLPEKGGVDYSEEDITDQKMVGICFPAGTMIQMADTSLKDIKDIKVGDEVIDAFGDKQVVKDTHSRRYQATTYTIEHFGSSIKTKTTAEHPFLMEDGTYKQAKDLTLEDYVAIPKINEVKDKTDFYYEREDDFLFLLGLYIAEGNVESYKHSISKRICFSFHKKELLLENFVARTLDKYFGLEGHTQYPKTNGMHIRFSSEQVGTIFEELGGKYAKNKRIHPKFMLMEPKKQLEIVKGWFAGDGSFKEHLYAVTISENLARQVVQILLRNGINCNFRVRKAKLYDSSPTVKSRQDAYEIVLNKAEMSKIYSDEQTEQTSSYYKIGKNHIYKKIKSIKKEATPYGSTLTVYNFGTTGSESYTANFIGVHNCTSISLVQQAQKYYGKKYSWDFFYAIQKMEYDGNWEEGSSLWSALNVGNKIGFLPVEYFPSILAENPKIRYDEYVKVLKQRMTPQNIALWKSRCENKIANYKEIKDLSPEGLATAINDSKTGIYTRIDTTTDWFMKNGKYAYKAADLCDIKKVGRITGGHAITISKYDFSNYNKIFWTNTWGTNWCYPNNGTGTSNALECSPTHAFIIFWSQAEVPRFKFLRDLSFGMVNADVKELQIRLQKEGLFNVTPIGRFGNITLKAVKDYQTRQGITPSGVVNKETRDKLNA